jgi:hypothetical protein
MPWQHHLDIHLGSALHDRIKIIHLEPEQHTIPIGPVGAIADGAMMMFDVETVQLQNKPATLRQLLILFAAVNSAATQQALIPLAAGFDIRDADERLRVHGSYSNKTLPWPGFPPLRLFSGASA